MIDNELYNDKQWDWERRSKDPNLTISDIMADKNKQWDWWYVSRNPSITLDDYTIMQLTWDVDGLRHNKNFRHNVSFSFWFDDKFNIQNYITFLERMNNSIIFEIDSKRAWDSSKYINFNKIKDIPIINSDALSMNNSVTIKNIEDNPQIKWNWWYISLNLNITIKDVVKYKDKDWAWCHLSEHPNITLTDINNHRDLPWNKTWIQFNPNIDTSVKHVYVIINKIIRNWKVYRLNKLFRILQNYVIFIKSL